MNGTALPVLSASPQSIMVNKLTGFCPASLLRLLASWAFEQDYTIGYFHSSQLYVNLLRSVTEQNITGINKGDCVKVSTVDK